MRHQGIVATGMLVCGLVWVVATKPLALSQTPPAPLSSEDIGHVRIERTVSFRKPWEAFLVGDVLQRADLFAKRIETPQSAPEVDVTFTATLDIKTTRRDSASLQATYIAEGGHRENVMDPGFFPLLSSAGRAATSTTWAARSLVGGGKTYEFQLAVSVLDLDRDRSAVARGKNLTVVIEMWPAGR